MTPNQERLAKAEAEGRRLRAERALLREEIARLQEQNAGMLKVVIEAAGRREG